MPLLRIIIIIIKIITIDYFNIVFISIFEAKVSLARVIIIIFLYQGCVEGLKDFVNNHLLILGVIAVSISAIQVRNECRGHAFAIPIFYRSQLTLDASQIISIFCTQTSDNQHGTKSISKNMEP